MADYWISRDKYFCKYCKIYIADDKPSRLHHETGLRHKGNYERYIRDIYKRGARAEKDKVEEAKEIARIDAAAKAAMGLEPEPDEGPVASTSKAPVPAPAPKPSDPYANYTTAESLGYRDDVAEKRKEEAELRQKEGTIGQWQKVAKRPPPPPPPVVPRVPTGGILPIGSAQLIKKEPEGGNGAVKQEDEKPRLAPRTADRGPNDEEGETESSRRRGYFTEKSYDAGEDEFDPTKLAAGPIRLKRKRLTLKEEEQLERERRAREDATVPIVGIGERGTGGGRGGWTEAEVKEEPLLEFADENKPAPLETKEEEKPDVKPAAGTIDEKPSTAATGGGTGFKKRKMHGAGTVRKK